MTTWKCIIVLFCLTYSMVDMASMRNHHKLSSHKEKQWRKAGEKRAFGQLSRGGRQPSWLGCQQNGGICNERKRRAGLRIYKRSIVEAEPEKGLSISELQQLKNDFYAAEKRIYEQRVVKALAEVIQSDEEEKRAFGTLRLTKNSQDSTENKRVFGSGRLGGRSGLGIAEQAVAKDEDDKGLKSPEIWNSENDEQGDFGADKLLDAVEEHLEMMGEMEGNMEQRRAKRSTSEELDMWEGDDHPLAGWETSNNREDRQKWADEEDNPSMVRNKMVLVWDGSKLAFQDSWYKAAKEVTNECNDNNCYPWKRVFGSSRIKPRPVGRTPNWRL